MFEKIIQIVQIRNGWLLILPPDPTKLGNSFVAMGKEIVNHAVVDTEMQRLQGDQIEPPIMPMSFKASMEEEIMFFPKLKDLFAYMEMEEEGL